MSVVDAPWPIKEIRTQVKTEAGTGDGRRDSRCLRAALNNKDKIIIRYGSYQFLDDLITYNGQLYNSREDKKEGVKWERLNLRLDQLIFFFFCVIHAFEIALIN